MDFIKKLGLSIGLLFFDGFFYGFTYKGFLANTFVEWIVFIAILYSAYCVFNDKTERVILITIVIVVIGLLQINYVKLFSNAKKGLFSLLETIGPIFGVIVICYVFYRMFTKRSNTNYGRNTSISRQATSKINNNRYDKVEIENDYYSHRVRTKNACDYLSEYEHSTNGKCYHCDAEGSDISYDVGYRYCRYREYYEKCIIYKKEKGIIDKTYDYEGNRPNSWCCSFLKVYDLGKYSSDAHRCEATGEELPYDKAHSQCYYDYEKCPIFRKYMK